MDKLRSMAAVVEFWVQCNDESSEERSLSLLQMAREMSADNLEQPCSCLRTKNWWSVCLSTKSTSLILLWGFLAGLFHSICINSYFMIGRFTKYNIELDIFVACSLSTLCFSFSTPLPDCWLIYVMEDTNVLLVVYGVLLVEVHQVKRNI